jgi:glycosyltransferase involved in cell wall biosynthesis
MRILLPVHAFPPRSTAGVEVYTLRTAKALGALGHDVLVLAAVHDLAAEPYALRRRLHEGVQVAEVVNVHQSGTLEATYADPQLDRVAGSVLDAFRPDIVHFQHLLNLSSGVIGEARRRGARVLLTLHDYWLGCPRDGLRMRADLKLCATIEHAVCARCLRDSSYLVPSLQRGLSRVARGAGLGRHLHRLHAAAPAVTAGLLVTLRRLGPTDEHGLEAGMDARADRLREALKGVDRFLAPTLFARDRAVAFGVAAERVEVAPLAALSEAPIARRGGARRRLGFVGTLAPHKGVHVLLQAFRAHADPEATLDLFGNPAVNPAYVAGLRREAAGDPRIRWRGAFAEGEQRRVHGALDALVLPSVWWENSPLSVIEALAAGLPVVASRIGGVPEIVDDGRTGLLVTPGDVAALGRAIADLGAGRALAEPLGPLPFRTVREGAAALSQTYARIFAAPPA